MGLIARRAEKYKSVDGYLKELWRPLMAWNYAIIVLFDFMLGPILLGIYSVATHQPYIQWQPLTIQGGGMFHIAMGAVIGVSAWSRGQEKISGNEGGGMPGMPSGWDTNAKPGPLIPQYVPPPQNNQLPSQYSQHMSVPAPTPQFNQMPANLGVVNSHDLPFTPTPMPAAPQVPAPLPVAQIAEPMDDVAKSKTGFPKAKRF